MCYNYGKKSNKYEYCHSYVLKKTYCKPHGNGLFPIYFMQL